MAPVTGLLEIADLTVTFDGFRAVDGVDLSIAEGELRFLIGPNGAGKTTVLDAVTGLCRATGSARFAGEELLGLRPHRIVRRGVGRTFQTSAVFDALSVLENVDLAASWRRRLPGLLRRRTRVAPAVADALEVVDLSGRLSLPAGVLSHGQRRWLEIAMLLAQDPRLLLLDEPVAGMTRAERERTGAAAATDRRAPHGRDRRARHGLPPPVRAPGDRAARGTGAQRGHGRPGASGRARPRGLPRPGAGGQPRRPREPGAGGGVLTVEGLRAGYGRTLVLDGVDLAVERG